MSESTVDPKPRPRLTEDVRDALLDANEGFTASTSYSDKNWSDDRTYTIRGGQLHVRSHNKTSFGGSRRVDEFVADEAATHRFLRDRMHRLSFEGVEESAAARKAARVAEQRAARKAAQEAERLTASSSTAAAQAHKPAEKAVEEAAPVVAGRSGGPSMKVVAGIAAAVAGVAAVVVLAPKAKRAWQRRRAAKTQAAQERADLAEGSVEGKDTDEGSTTA